MDDKALFGALATIVLVLLFVFGASLALLVGVALPPPKRVAVAVRFVAFFASSIGFSSKQSFLQLRESRAPSWT